MKSLWTILLLVFSAAVLSCNGDKPNPTPPPPTLEVSTPTLNMPASNGSTQLSITSNTDWTISGVADWQTIDPISGKGNGNITVTWLANPTDSQRTSTITVKSATLTKTIAATQAGAEQPTLEVAPTGLSFTPNAEEKTISITSNTKWQITGNNDWCTADIQSGTGSKTAKISITANETYIERKTTLSIVANNLTKSVTIIQSAKKNPESQLDDLEQEHW